MGLLHLAIAALAATAVLAADPPCKCVNPDQVYNSISAPLMFFQQPTEDGTTSGKTCSMSCTFTAKLDVDSPDYALQIQVLATNKLGDGMLQYTGTNAVNNVINSNTPPGVLPDISYGDTITITFTEGATNLGEFMLVVQKVKGRAEPPVVKTTTLAPPTAPYDPKFTHNPRLVANDIMLVFDMSSPDIEKYKTFAQNMINELSLNPKSLDPKDDEDCGDGSRLSIVGLSGLSGFTNLYAPYWTTTAQQALGNIGSIVQIGATKFFWNPIDDQYIYGFDMPKNENNRSFAYTNCTNKEKLFVLFTSSAPSEFDKLDLTNGGTVAFTDFVNRGVHQILVRYNMTEDDKLFYNNTKFDNVPAGTKADGANSNIWNIFELTGGDKDIENFFNQYLVVSKDPMTCQPTPDKETKKTDKVIGVGTVSVNIPPYYKAVGVDGGKWETIRHYCNFQETTVKLTKDPTLLVDGHPEATTRMCVKVFYDLETGKDFVSIFSGNPGLPAAQEEVVRLTGRDVSGTTFELTDAMGSIVFSSDEKNVYDGFHAEIYKWDEHDGCNKS